MGYKKKILIAFIILIIFSSIFLLIKGQTYILKIENIENISNLDEVNINIQDEKNVVECVDKSFENGTLTLTFKSKQKVDGKAYIEIEDTKENYIESNIIYVHKLGIITYGNFFREC